MLCEKVMSYYSFPSTFSLLSFRLFSPFLPHSHHSLKILSRWESSRETRNRFQPIMSVKGCIAYELLSFSLFLLENDGMKGEKKEYFQREKERKRITALFTSTENKFLQLFKSITENRRKISTPIQKVHKHPY